MTSHLRLSGLRPVRRRCSAGLGIEGIGLSPIASQVEIRALCPLGSKGAPMSNRQREELAETYEKLFQCGQITRVDIVKALLEYDATYATIKMARYSLVSTIIAACSALASAAAAYFAYAALHVTH